MIMSITARAGLALALFTAAAGAAATRTWTFDGDKPQSAPPGFTFARTGDGRAGRWLVVAAPDAPSGDAVLAQLDTDETDYRFPIAVAPEVRLKNVRLSVKCKPVEGKVDQACGLVFRYKDENNYYLARLNALENNVRLYHVQDGRRIQFAGWNGKVTKNAWHDLVIEARDNNFQVHFDGKRVIEAADRTFLDDGAIGLWTKADSVSHFDDLAVTGL
jgi:hypothetical protein